MCLGCHVVTVDVEIKSLPALRAACERLGWKMKEGRHEWFGAWVDDSPVPRQLFASEEEYQKVLAMPREYRKEFMTDLINRSIAAIKVPGNFYEIGVHQVGDHCALSLDWYGGRQLQTDAQKIIQPYAIEAALEVARSQCATITETQQEDGSVQLRISVRE